MVHLPQALDPRKFQRCRCRLNSVMLKLQQLNFEARSLQKGQKIVIPCCFYFLANVSFFPCVKRIAVAGLESPSGDPKLWDASILDLHSCVPFSEITPLQLVSNGVTIQLISEAPRPHFPALCVTLRGSDAPPMTATPLLLIDL